MNQIDNATAAQVMPDMGPVGPNPNGFFREKDALLGQPGTHVDATWLNMMQTELCNVVVGAGLPLLKTSQTQLLEAIEILIAAAVSTPPKTITVSQVGHGFVVGDWLFLDNGTWFKARATTLRMSWNVAVVASVSSTNVFEIVVSGYISGLSGLTPGLYYLSTETFGAIQTNAPAELGDIVKPVIVADTATSGYVLDFMPTVFGQDSPTDGMLLAANNLSDLPNVVQARANLGLGSAAVANANAFIPAATLATLATLSYVDAADEALQQAIDDLDSSVSGDISTLQSNVATLSSTVVDLSTDIDDLQDDVSDINTTLSSKQPLDATLTALAALVFGTNNYVYSTGIDAFALGVMTPFARTILDDADATTMRATLGLGTAATFASSAFIASSVLATLATITYVDDSIGALDFATDTYVNAQIATAIADLTTETYVNNAIDAAIAALDYATPDYVDGAVDAAVGPVASDVASAQSAITTLEGNVATINTALSTKQPLDATLTAFAGVTFAPNTYMYATGADAFSVATMTPFARTILDDADAATARTTLGLGTAAVAASTDFIASSVLSTLATKTYVDDSIAALDFATETFVTDSISAAVAGLATETYVDTSIATAIDALDFATEGYVDTAVATKQPLDATLTAFAGVTFGPNTYMYATAADTFTTGTITSFGRGLIDDADAATARTTLGLGSAALSASTDFIASSVLTTLATKTYVDTAIADFATESYVDSAIAAGLVGVATTGYVDTVATTLQPLSTVLTELSALTDPGVGSITYWNDSTNNFEFLELSADFSITAGVLSVVGGGGIAAVEDDPSPTLGGGLDGDENDIYNVGNLTVNSDIQAYGSIATFNSSKYLKLSVDVGAVGNLDLVNVASGNRTVYLPDASGTLALTSDIPSPGIASVQADAAPKLGANLDINSYSITGSGNINTTGTATFSGLVTASAGITATTGEITASSGPVVSVGSGYGLVHVHSSGRAVLLTCSGSAAVSTMTTIVAGQTADRTIGLPDASDILVGKNTTDILTNKTVTNCKETVATPTVSAGAVTIALSNGTLQKVVTAANTTITLPAAVAGTSYTLLVQYGGTHTITWAGGGTLKWAGGSAPSATSVNGKYDIYVFVCHDGTNTLASDGGRNY